MRRYLLGTLAAVATTGIASAQHRGGGPAPGHAGGAPHVAGYHPGGGGGVYHAPASGFRMVQAPPVYRSTGVGVGVGSGLYGGYGLGGGVGLSRGYGYGYGYGSGGFISGGYSPYFVLPQQGYLGGGGGPAYVPPPAEPSGATAVSGLLPATLILQYPAPARVWLDGVEVPGDPDTSWTFTSKDLRAGETATFKVRARWEAGGKTYEAAREIPLGPGARSRLVVVSGNEVTE